MNANEEVFPDINGLDLKIDDSITELCKISNHSSGNTRSVIYVLVIATLLSLISVLNTWSFNWTKYRIKHMEYQIKNAKSSSDSVHFQKLLDYTLRNQIENYKTVRAPVLGNAFDVNNLGVISGLTFSILLGILGFTLSREGTNLSIALHAIEERYTDNADTDKFFKALNEKFDKESERWKLLIKKINLTRREHHYNFLTMNEVFNLPPTKHKKYRKNGVIFLISLYIFYFPAIIFLIIFLNDLCTIKAGMLVNLTLTIASQEFSLLFLICICFLCNKCTELKKKTLNQYVLFFDSLQKK